MASFVFVVTRHHCQDAFLGLQERSIGWISQASDLYTIGDFVWGDLVVGQTGVSSRSRQGAREDHNIVSIIGVAISSVWYWPGILLAAT